MILFYLTPPAKIFANLQKDVLANLQKCRKKTSRNNVNFVLYSLFGNTKMQTSLAIQTCFSMQTHISTDRDDKHTGLEVLSVVQRIVIAMMLRVIFVL